ncbi:AI-2E family transporter [Parapedobacter lycopersici]|uniref:AI-2E family transporter n=1 Tax=Parapedobacter lycopersici TaxID=1864939 RepID=UPI00214D99B2|nr:AI-2E family transporter [Parapedobacter lycopersici]
MQIHRTTRAANIVIISAVSIIALYIAAPFLIPLSLAALLAMLFYRFSEWQERKGIPRGLSALFSVLALLGTVVLIGVILAWQISGLTDNFDKMKEQVVSQFRALREWISRSTGIDFVQQQQLVTPQAQGGGSQAGNLFLKFINKLTGLLVDAVLVVVYTYLLLYYRTHIKRFILKAVPQSNRNHVRTIIRKSVDVSGDYLIGLFNMVAILWVMYSIGFSLVGLTGAVFFAILCGIFEIVPFIGNLVGNLVAVLAVLSQGGDAAMVLGILAVYLTIQFLQSYILEPLVVGQRVNINPLFTIIALVIGELLWGIAGMAMAIPLLGIVKIVCDNVPELHAYGAVIGPIRSRGDSTSVLNFLKRLLPGK